MESDRSAAADIDNGHIRSQPSLAQKLERQIRALLKPTDLVLVLGRVNAVPMGSTIVIAHRVACG